jgi:hypothetical protein
MNFDTCSTIVRERGLLLDSMEITEATESLCLVLSKHTSVHPKTHKVQVPLQ